MKNNTYIVFWIGLISTIIISILLYLFLPRYEYFGGSYLIYKPQNALPDAYQNNLTVSNIYLLLKLTKYAVIYWLIFSILYFLLKKIKVANVNPIFIWFHFALTVFGFSSLIYFNKYIVAPEPISQYLSDIFIGDKITKSQFQEMMQMTLLYESISIPTSVFGILLCIAGILVFAIGMITGWKTSANNL